MPQHRTLPLDRVPHVVSDAGVSPRLVNRTPPVNPDVMVVLEATGIALESLEEPLESTWYHTLLLAQSTPPSDRKPHVCR